MLLQSFELRLQTWGNLAVEVTRASWSTTTNSSLVITKWIIINILAHYLITQLISESLFNKLPLAHFARAGIFFAHKLRMAPKKEQQQRVVTSWSQLIWASVALMLLLFNSRTVAAIYSLFKFKQIDSSRHKRSERDSLVKQTEAQQSLLNGQTRH